MSLNTDYRQQYVCGNCFKPAAHTCSRCKQIVYCNAECQRTAANSHQVFCKAVGHMSKSFMTGIPQAHLTEMKETISLFVAPAQSNHPFVFPLKRTAQMELIPFIFFTFSSRLNPYTGLEQLPGMKLLANPDGDLHNECSNFTFGSEIWFNKKSLVCTKQLFNLTKDVLPFLESKGYKISPPKKGGVVVYSTYVRGKRERVQAPEVAHYGKISDVHQDGTVIVHSKFGPCGGIYEHHLELIPPYFGSSYTFVFRDGISPINDETVPVSDESALPKKI